MTPQPNSPFLNGNLGNSEFRKWLGEYRRKVSCGTAEGRSVKAEPSNHLGHSRSISDAKDGEAAKSSEIRFGFISKGQSGYQAPPAGSLFGGRRESTEGFRQVHGFEFGSGTANQPCRGF